MSHASPIINIMTAALICSSCEETFPFSAGLRSLPVSVESTFFPPERCLDVITCVVIIVVHSSNSAWSHPPLVANHSV